jgi:CRP/FNR family transcriptional regulator, dissimilatory nitrate respiration regulator
MPYIRQQKCLDQHPYFHELEAPVLERIAEQMIFMQYGAGEAIFFEEDETLGLWLVEQGRVKIYKLSSAGNEQILHILGEGNSFNDIAALDGGANPANASALSQLKVWLLPRAALKEAMLADSRLAMRISSILAKRVRSLVKQIEDLTLYSVVSRLARFLIRQIEDPALSGAGVTRTVIAAHLNTTPQTISNALNTLEEAGAIEFTRHQIIIIDAAALARLAEQA